MSKNLVKGLVRVDLIENLKVASHVAYETTIGNILASCLKDRDLKTISDTEFLDAIKGFIEDLVIKDL